MCVEGVGAAGQSLGGERSHTVCNRRGHDAVGVFLGTAGRENYIAGGHGRANGNLEVDGGAVDNGERAGAERTRARARCEAGDGGSKFDGCPVVDEFGDIDAADSCGQVVPRASVVAVHEVVRPATRGARSAQHGVVALGDVVKVGRMIGSNVVDRVVGLPKTLAALTLNHKRQYAGHGRRGCRRATHRGGRRYSTVY